LDRKFQGRFAGIGAILGCAATILIGALGAPPPTLQNWLMNPWLDVGIGGLAIGTAACLIVWARQSDHPDYMVLAIALITTGLLTVLINIIAPVVGWWHGPYFETRIVPLAVLHFTAPLPFGFILLGYRWLVARRPWLALGLYGALALLMIPGVVSADTRVLNEGWFAFGNGYQLWHDVLLGVVLFVAPLILYEVLSRSWRQTTLPPAIQTPH
jgi:hypothetical protein